MDIMIQRWKDCLVQMYNLGEVAVHIERRKCKSGKRVTDRRGRLTETVVTDRWSYIKEARKRRRERER